MNQNATLSNCFHTFDEIENYHKMIYIFATIFIAILGLGLNSYTLHLIRAHMTLQTYANGFVAVICAFDNLSILSLVLVIAEAQFIGSSFLKVIFDRIFCTSHDITILMIMVVAVDRFASLRYSLSYSSKMTGIKVTIIAVLCCLYSLSINTLPLVFQWITDYTGKGCERFKDHAYKYVLSVCLLYFPCLIIIMFCYSKICGIARNHTRAISALDRSVFYNYPDHRVQRNVKYMRTLLQVLVAFLLLTLPGKFCLILSKSEKWHLYFLIVATINCVINPWIYALNSPQFNAARVSLMSIRRSGPSRLGNSNGGTLSNPSGMANKEHFEITSVYSIENKGWKTYDNDDTEKESSDCSMSWAGFTKRQRSPSSRVSVTLFSENGDLQMTIEDLDCNVSRPSLQLNIECFRTDTQKVTITRPYNKPTEEGRH